MSTFLQLKGDCPICAGARRDCRQNRNTGIIHCRDAQANPIGFRFIREDALGFFMWAKAGQVEAQDWQDRLEARRQKKQAEQQQKLKRVLPVAERDRQFRSIARHSGLSLRHRNQIERRGLSPDQIEQAYSKSILWSWQSGATIPGATANLPGVDARGRLRNYPAGFAVAAVNERGEILGAQVRVDAPGSDYSKYCWLSSEAVGGNSIYLSDGEVPIGFYRPLTEQGSGAINIAEGLLKPFVIAQRHGVICLGAAGANFGSSPQLLKRYLEVASAELNTKQVVLNADAGSVSNPSILGAYRRLWALVEEWGYQFSIRWWRQVDKAGGDADEIDSATFASAELLTIEQFEAIARGYCLPIKSEADPIEQGAPDPQEYQQFIATQAEAEAIEQAQAEEAKQQWKQQAAEVARRKWERSKQFTPTHTINKQYVDYEIPVGANMVTLRAPLGSGKTEWQKRVLEYLKGGAIAIGSRNSLLLQTAVRCGFYHLHHDNAKSLIPDRNSRLATCIDSLIHFQDSDFDGRILVLDEFGSTLKHALHSATLKDKREECLHKFEEAIKRASLIIALDGLGTDIQVNCLTALRGKNLNLVKLLNEHKPIPIRAEIVRAVSPAESEEIKLRIRDNSPVQRKLLETLEACRLLPEGAAKAVTVISDSQRYCEALDKLLTSKGYRVLRVDSKTTTQPNIKLCLNEPNTYIEQEKPDVLILSPTAESGVNIHIKNYFRHGFAFFFGVVDADSQMQFLRRARACLDWTISCPEYTRLGEDKIGATFPSQLQRRICELIELNLNTALHGQDKEEAGRQWLAQFGEELNNPFTLAYIETQATRNYEYQHTRECLEAMLKAEGHEVTIVTLDSDKEASEEVKAAKDEVIKAEAAAIFNAKDIGIEEAIRIRTSFTANLEQRHSAAKAFLKARLPGIENEPVWNANFIELALLTDRSYLSQIERYWALRNMDFTSSSAAERWRERVDNGEMPFIGDINTDYAKLKALHAIGLLDFLGRAGVSADDEAVQQLYQRCKRSRPIQIALGRAPGKLTPMDWIGRLMQSIGVTAKTKQVKIPGTKNKQRLYSYPVPEQDLTVLAVLRCLDRKRDQKMAEKLAGQRTELEHLSPKNNTFIGGGVPWQNLTEQGFKGDRQNKFISAGETARKGLKVGDEVIALIDHLSEDQQLKVVATGEVEVGLIGTIQRIEQHNQRMAFAVLIDEWNRQHRVSLDYLTRLEEAV